MSQGHELARRQISKHGVDRYPDVKSQFAKVEEETLELREAIFDHLGGICGCGFGGVNECPNVRREYADVGLSLFALGDEGKLGMDLIGEMGGVVAGDERKF